MIAASLREVSAPRKIKTFEKMLAMLCVLKKADFKHFHLVFWCKVES